MGILRVALAGVCLVTGLCAVQLVIGRQERSSEPRYPDLSLEAIRHSALRHKYANAARPAGAPANSAAAATTATTATSSLASTGATAPPPAFLTRAAFLERVPEGGLAFFTVANDAYADLAINWALLLIPVLEPLGAAGHLFLGALDRQLATKLLARGLPTMRVGLSGAHDGAEDAPTTNFRLTFSKFRAYGVTKADLIVWLLRARRHVVVSDVDCAWLSPPHYLLTALAEADVMAGTDCLHVLADDDRSERRASEPRCGHHAGSSWAAWFNTGVLVFRATAAAISFAERWRDNMAAVHGEGTFGNQVDDQLTFNQLVEWNGTVGKREQGHLYPIRAARPDGRILYDASGVRTIAPLPARTICSGHVFHIQQGIERRDCIVMHLTFVEADRAGKRWRLREAGLFPIAPEATSGRFLTYTPPQPVGPVPPERHPSLMRPAGCRTGCRLLPVPNKTRWPGGGAQSEGWPISAALFYAPRLGAHMELVDRHIYAMKQAIAVARVLGRQLIMPRLLCLCERAQQPWDVVPSCIKLGTTTELPFVCPMENFLNVEELEGLWAPEGFVTPWSSLGGDDTKPAPSRPYVTLRPWTLLNGSFHPEAAAKLSGAAVARVRWVDPGPDGPDPAAAGNVEGGGELAVPLGLTDAELVAAMAHVKEAPLLHLEHAEAPIFGGWESASDGAFFEEEIRKWVIPGSSRFSGTWCCTHAHYQAGTLLYKNPARFPSGAEWSRKPRRLRLAALRAQMPAQRRRNCYWDACRDTRYHDTPMWNEHEW